MKAEKLRHIRKEGHSKVIAVTGLVPDNWEFVRIKPVGDTSNTKRNTILLSLERVK